MDNSKFSLPVNEQIERQRKAFEAAAKQFVGRPRSVKTGCCGDNMKLTQQRLDSWLVKGFDGASQFAIDRTSQEKKPEQSHLNALAETIQNIEETLANPDCGTMEQLDNYLFPQMLQFSQILVARAREVGGLGLTDRDNLSTYLDRLRKARERLSA